MYNVLFICYGNICRSPMAEMIFKDLIIKNNKRYKFSCVSRATSMEELGNDIYPQAKRKLLEMGVTCEAHRATQMTKDDYNKYDYIIVMEERNKRDVIRIVGEDKDNKIHLLMEYTKRLKKYTSIELIEVKDEGIVEESKAISLEAEKIKKYLNTKDYIITMEIEGKQLTSEEFSDKLNQIQIENSNIVFIIGGSYGLSDEIKQKCNYSLSFSKMTFPHQLFRLMLIEQIYRAFKIINNETYHK